MEEYANAISMISFYQNKILPQVFKNILESNIQLTGAKDRLKESELYLEYLYHKLWDACPCHIDKINKELNDTTLLIKLLKSQIKMEYYEVWMLRNIIKENYEKAREYFKCMKKECGDIVELAEEGNEFLHLHKIKKMNGNHFTEIYDKENAYLENCKIIQKNINNNNELMTWLDELEPVKTNLNILRDLAISERRMRT